MVYKLRYISREYSHLFGENVEEDGSIYQDTLADNSYNYDKALKNVSIRKKAFSSMTSCFYNKITFAKSLKKYRISLPYISCFKNYYIGSKNNFRYYYEKSKYNV